MMPTATVTMDTDAMSAAAPSKHRPRNHKAISAKIRKLRGEGYSAKQAAAIAYSMDARGELGPKGGRKK